MATFETNHTFRNWAETLNFKPERYCQPDNEAEVVTIVKDVLANGGRIRTTGAGHSWSHFVVTDKTLLQLDKLNDALIADVPNLRYTVQGGVRLKHLIGMLEQVGLGLKNIGSITEQSIAGATATGTHGTGIRLGNLSTSIVGMHIVTGTGDVLKITETDTDLLNAARVSIGALGIVTEVTLACVPHYQLENTTYFCKFDTVIDKLDQLNQENERFLLWWLVAPFGPKDNVVVVTMNPPGTPAGLLGQATVAATGPGAPGRLPMDTNDVLNVLSRLFPQPTPFQKFLTQKGKWNQMLTIPLIPVFHREFEYAIPAERTTEALLGLRTIFEEGDISTTLPVEVRYVAKDESLLSPSRGRDVCYIGIATQPNANEVYSRVEPLMKDLGGRPHWGKHFSLRRSEVEAMYPDSFDKFRKLRKELDPKGVFANSLVKEFFD
jgi:FAD/FMN-containing dehydrogenase